MVVVVVVLSSKLFQTLVFVRTEEPRNDSSANKENQPITKWIFSPQMLILLILCIGNKASLALTGPLKYAIAGFLCILLAY